MVVLDKDRCKTCPFKVFGARSIVQWNWNRGEIFIRIVRRTDCRRAPEARSTPGSELEDVSFP